MTVNPNADLEDGMKMVIEFLCQEYEKEANAVSRVCPHTLDSGTAKYALGRKFFITEKGYFGLAPAGAKSGDKIAILWGSSTPFVLRSSEIPDDPRWTILGETYVHGIMEGEVMAEEAAGNVKSSTILIK
ncbi:hypothetical protein F5B20DRAFT_530584 [Whalleya microplaca]|nr:hypothetical protein F5B20DRAFT_530584 [Whalleya microplaca]